MKDSLYSLAKITRPGLTGILPRQRLFSLIEGGGDQSIIWLTGPPGCGKTTLVSSYLENRKPDSLWYQLDQGEADIATFFYYLRLAAHKKYPGDLSSISFPESVEDIPHFANRYIRELGKKFVSATGNIFGDGPAHRNAGRKLLLKYSPEYLGDLATFTRGYFRDLFARLHNPFVMVFDDYQNVPRHSQFHNVIRYGLSELPPGGRVVIVSRNKPPDAMAKFFANRQMKLLGWDDLRLTQDESDEIVKLHGLELSGEKCHQLYTKTQGWAAGLVLMLEHIGIDGLLPDSPETLTPTVIYDYLAREIYQKLDQSTRDFLSQTAIVPRLTAAIAEALTSNPSSASILDELSRRHHFVSANRRLKPVIYEYHPIFRDFLRAAGKSPVRQAMGRINYEKVITLLEKNGQLEDAIELLLENECWEQLVDVIQRHASELIQDGRRETFAQWLDEFPIERMKENPWMIYWLAACRFPFALRESRRFYEQAYALFASASEPDVSGMVQSCSGIMRAILYEGDDLALLDPWIAIADELLRSHSGALSEGVESHVTSCLFMSMGLRQPDNPDIEYWVEKAYTASKSQPLSRFHLAVALHIAFSYMWVGYFSKTHEVLSLVGKVLARIDAEPLALITQKNIESMCLMLEAKGEDCLMAMQEGLEIAQRAGVTLWSQQLRINGLGGALGVGDLDTADRLLEEIALEPAPERRQEQSLINYLSAWAAILRGDTLLAFQFQKTALRLSIEVGNPFIEIICRLAMAQILFECGDERKGAAHLRQVHELARNINNHLLEFMSFLCYAYLALEHGRRRSGLKSLHYAMQLGREYGYRHTLWWRPEVMAELCAAALEEQIEVDYVRSLIKLRGLAPPASGNRIDEWPWIFRIHTLGQCKLLKDDHSIGMIAKLQRKPMELMKAIIAFGGRDVPEQRLAEALWPGVDETYSRRSLTTAIHRLRKILGEDRAILVSEGCISLNSHYCWLDTWALERLAGEVEQLCEVDIMPVDTDRASSVSSKLLKLYGGPFMASETEREWYVAARAELGACFLHCMRKLAKFWDEHDDVENAIQCYRRILEIDEGSEEGCRGLMFCYTRLGKREEAIEVYKSYRKAMDASSDTSVSPEIVAVYESLMKK